MKYYQITVSLDVCNYNNVVLSCLFVYLCTYKALLCEYAELVDLYRRFVF